MPVLKRRAQHLRGVGQLTVGQVKEKKDRGEQAKNIELQQRSEAYSHFGLIAALLIGGALALLIEARNSRSRCEYHFIGVICELLSSVVLALNFNGLAILCLQDHHVGRLLSTHSYATAKEAFIKTKDLRRHAVSAVAWSMPAMLWYAFALTGRL